MNETLQPRMELLLLKCSCYALVGWLGATVVKVSFRVSILSQNVKFLSADSKLSEQMQQVKYIQVAH